MRRMHALLNRSSNTNQPDKKPAILSHCRRSADRLAQGFDRSGRRMPPRQTIDVGIGLKIALTDIEIMAASAVSFQVRRSSSITCSIFNPRTTWKLITLAELSLIKARAACGSLLDPTEPYGRRHSQELRTSPRRFMNRNAYCRRGITPAMRLSAKARRMRNTSTPRWRCGPMIAPELSHRLRVGWQSLYDTLSASKRQRLHFLASDRPGVSYQRATWAGSRELAPAAAAARMGQALPETPEEMWYAAARKPGEAAISASASRD